MIKNVWKNMQNRSFAKNQKVKDILKLHYNMKKLQTFPSSLQK